MNLWLSGLANINTGLSVKFEFQKNNNFFTSMFQILHRICLYSKTITYLKFKFNWEFCIFPSNPR